MQHEEVYIKHFGKEWAAVLRPLFLSKPYKEVGLALAKLKKDGAHITPGYKNIFRAFKECPLHSLHTIIISDDIYSGLTSQKECLADGIAYSSNVSTDTPPPLNSIFEAIDYDVFDSEYVPTSVWKYEWQEAVWDLKTWANQGILMLNRSLTTLIGTPHAHTDLWAPIIDYIVYDTTSRTQNLGIILMGDRVQEIGKRINGKSQLILKCESPVDAIERKRSFQHNQVFSEVTKFHKTINNIKVKW
jgi:uracil-DNA glycosylase